MFYILYRKDLLEGVFDVLQAVLAGPGEDTHDVEADGVEGRFSFGEIKLGQGAEGILFAGSDGLEWAAEAGSSAQLDLDEDEGGALAHDEVDLSVTRAVIALDELVAASHQVAQRQLLAPLPGRAPAQAPTPA